MKIGSVCLICLVAGVALSVFEYVLQIGATQSNMGGKKALRIAALFRNPAAVAAWRNPGSRADSKCRIGSVTRTAVADVAGSPAAVLFLFMYADGDLWERI